MLGSLHAYTTLVHGPRLTFTRDLTRTDLLEVCRTLASDRYCPTPDRCTEGLLYERYSGGYKGVRFVPMGSRRCRWPPDEAWVAAWKADAVLFRGPGRTADASRRRSAASCSRRAAERIRGRWTRSRGWPTPFLPLLR